MKQRVTLILDVFLKKTEQTPQSIIANCKRRLRDYEKVSKGGSDEKK